MPRLGVTKQDVYEVAQQIISQNDTPTVTGVRAILGRGSSVTIQKHLKKWKQQCFQRAGESITALSTADDANFVVEKRALEQTVIKQKAQNEMISTQLIQAEREIAKLRESKELAETQLKELTTNYDQILQQSKLFEELYQNIHAERETAAQVIIDDKNKLVESLREELKQSHQESLDKIREVGHNGHDRLMEEKIIAINLKEEIKSFQEKITSLEVGLEKANKANQPLRQEITRQNKFIQEVVTFEQLQEYEKRKLAEQFEGSVK